MIVSANTLIYFVVFGLERIMNATKLVKVKARAHLRKTKSQLSLILEGVPSQNVCWVAALNALCTYVSSVGLHLLAIERARSGIFNRDHMLIIGNRTQCGHLGAWLVLSLSCRL